MASLQMLDTRIAKVGGLTPADLEWTKHLELNPGEIRSGMNLRSDFIGDVGKRWSERIDDFLAATSPNVELLFKVGFIGWIDRHRPEKLVLFMALNMVLETLFRVSVRLHGGSILRTSVSSDPEGCISFRYKMLDQHELCAPETLDRLVESVDPSSRGSAKAVLTLAVKVRDVVAHGATATFEMENSVAMGHVLIKAIQCLVQAGERGMTKVAAYHRWQSAPLRKYTDELAGG